MILDRIDNVKITGLEYSNEAIIIAEDMNTQVKYNIGDIMEMAFDDNSFDIEICFGVLEYLVDLNRALIKIGRASNNYICHCAS